jgi:two-component system, NarL family, nitrate/nitrite response regulator NarL
MSTQVANWPILGEVSEGARAGCTRAHSSPKLKAVIILLVEEDSVGAALSRALSVEADSRVLRAVSTEREAIASSQMLHPTVVVIDNGLPDGTSAKARPMKEATPDIEVVMMTGSGCGAVLTEARGAGCSGFVPKETHLSELVSAIRGVVASQVRVAPDPMAVLLEHLRPHPRAPGGDLTPRELEVLHRLAAGETTNEIADALFLSVHTVRNHIANTLSKLHARSRLEAVAIATRDDLISATPWIR